MPKNAVLFECTFCNFVCSKKSNYTTHLSTLKHQYRTNLEQKNAEMKDSSKYICTKCNKQYSARNSLWYHSKKCKKDENSVNIFANC